MLCYKGPQGLMVLPLVIFHPISQVVNAAAQLICPFAEDRSPRRQATYLPSVPTGNCGLCCKVTNKGGHGGVYVNGVGTSIIVQIIDSFPAVNAWNSCKTDIPVNEKCRSFRTNQLDADLSALPRFLFLRPMPTYCGQCGRPPGPSFR